jgi:hypothetical protein
MLDSVDDLPLFSRRSAVPPEPRAVTPSEANDFPLAEYLRQFDRFGQRTTEIIEDTIPYFVNEFWTSGQRQGHSLHEISYRACFKPQLPEFFITRLTAPNDLVFDPFMGRGTTPIEAAIHGRRAGGSDINPLSTLLCRPRIRGTDVSGVQKSLNEIDWTRGDIENPDLLVFFSRETLRQINALRHWIDARTKNSDLPDVCVDWIRMVALNRLTGHSPGFFSVYSLPPNQATSVAAQRKINDKRGQTPPDRNVASIILKKTKSLLRDGQIKSAAMPELYTAPADSINSVKDGAVSLVVTSPPFLDIVHYAEDNWLRCWFAGIEPDSIPISMYRTERAWQDMVRNTLKELARIVRPGGYIAFEVGEVRNGKVLLERLVWAAAENLPFERMLVMVNSQTFTKTANCWGVKNNIAGTNSNRIVILRRKKG